MTIAEIMRAARESGTPYIVTVRWRDGVVVNNLPMPGDTPGSLRAFFGNAPARIQVRDARTGRFA